MTDDPIPMSDLIPEGDPMTTTRPTVTAEIDWPRQQDRTHDGDTLRDVPGVHIEVSFALHDHQAAIYRVRAAAAACIAQIEETR